MLLAPLVWRLGVYLGVKGAEFAEAGCSARRRSSGAQCARRAIQVPEAGWRGLADVLLEVLSEAGYLGYVRVSSGELAVEREEPVDDEG